MRVFTLILTAFLAFKIWRKIVRVVGFPAASGATCFVVVTLVLYFIFRALGLSSMFWFGNFVMLPLLIKLPPL